jgi:predicted RNA-binding protein (virulence factor B family)
MQLGDYNTLKINRRTEHGLYLCEVDADLQSEDLQEILLPKKFITEDMEEGNDIEVFVYRDSEDRPVATTQRPIAKAGEVAFMKVKEETNAGMFLDWGLDKDLLLPFSEQKVRAEVGRYALVYVYFDQGSHRLAASSNINKFIKNREVTVAEGDEVSILPADKTEIGIRCIVNNKHWGILYNNEIFGEVKKGRLITAYVRKVREDGKIDLSINKQVFIENADDYKGTILHKLQEANGRLNVCDRSTPEAIYAAVGMSKKNFKKACGMLFKEGRINILADGIVLKRK